MIGVMLVIILILFTSPIQSKRIKRQTATYDKGTNSCTTVPPDSKEGKCINIKQCPEMLTVLTTVARKNTTALKALMRNLCFYQSREVIICCPEKVEVKSTTKFPEQSVCGLTDVKHDRVVGGQPAKLGAWPWVTALGYVTPTRRTPEWLCGGSLVNERYVVTAAHCLVNTGRNELSVVRLGELDLNDKKSDGAKPLDFSIEKKIVHEEYNAAKHSTDIGLVKLMSRVTYTNLIKPICLPFSSELKSNSLEGYTPFLAGWGALSYKGPSSTLLQEVQIDISDIPSCQKSYANIKGATIDQRVICAGRTGKDACQGDSGGPLMLPRGNNFYLIGVVSYGFKCAEPGYPGIYTRVTQFVDWIDKNIEL